MSYKMEGKRAGREKSERGEWKERKVKKKETHVPENGARLLSWDKR